MNNIANANQEDFEFNRDILGALDTPAFKIHGIEFTCAEVIQAFLFSSMFMYNIVYRRMKAEGINTFMITINPEDKMMLCQAGQYSKTLVRMGNGYGPNTVMVHKPTGTLSFFVTCGFLMDNFKFREPKEELAMAFVLPDTGDVVMDVKDFEGIMKPER